MKPSKFILDQSVWMASCEIKPIYHVCPDCGGSARIRLTYDSGETVSIDCVSCTRGSDSLIGFITVFEQVPEALHKKVIGISIDKDRYVYKLVGRGYIEEDLLFDSASEALSKAQQMAAAANQESIDELLHIVLLYFCPPSESIM